MQVDDGGDGWLSDWTTIEVNLSTLADVAASVEAEVSSNLEPHSRRLMNVYATGVNFGYGNPSLDLDAAKRKYHDCLVNTVAQLAYFVTASRVLASAARTVIERYGNADALTEATILEVRNAMGKAAASANLAAAEAEANAAEQAAAARHDMSPSRWDDQ